MKISKLTKSAAACALAISSGAAFAVPDFTVTALGGIGSGGNNLVYNPCSAPILGPALTTRGCLNGANNNLLVNAIGTENLLVNGGQARVEAADGSFTFVTIDPLNFYASSIIMNINAAATGSVVFSNASGSSSSFAVSSGGSNAFRIDLTSASDLVNLISFTSTVQIQDVRQVRFDIGQAPTNNVPVPASAALLGLGLLGLSIARKAKKA
jgi:hypothetical protein